MNLENGVTYEYLRSEGRKATWEEIRQSRKRLHRFVDRPKEYKQVFDMILRSYI